MHACVPFFSMCSCVDALRERKIRNLYWDTHDSQQQHFQGQGLVLQYIQVESWVFIDVSLTTGSISSGHTILL